MNICLPDRRCAHAQKGRSLSSLNVRLISVAIESQTALGFVQFSTSTTPASWLRHRNTNDKVAHGSDRKRGRLVCPLRLFPIAQPWFRPTSCSVTNCGSPVLEFCSEIAVSLHWQSSRQHTNLRSRPCENPKMHDNDNGILFSNPHACVQTASEAVIIVRRLWQMKIHDIPLTNIRPRP